MNTMIGVIEVMIGEMPWLLQSTSAALMSLGYALAVGNFNADDNQGKKRIKRLTFHRGMASQRLWSAYRS